MPINWKDKLNRLTKIPNLKVDGQPIKEVVAPIIETPMIPEKLDVEQPRHRKAADAMDLANASLRGAAVTVTSGGVRLLAMKRNRIYAAIVNHSSNVIYIVLGNSPVVNQGIALSQYGSFEFGLATDCPFVGEVWAISSANANVGIVEL